MEWDKGERSHSVNSQRFGSDRPEHKVYVPNNSNAFFASGFKMVDANKGKLEHLFKRKTDTSRSRDKKEHDASI